MLQTAAKSQGITTSNRLAESRGELAGAELTEDQAPVWEALAITTGESSEHQQYFGSQRQVVKTVGAIVAFDRCCSKFG